MRKNDLSKVGLICKPVTAVHIYLIMLAIESRLTRLACYQRLDKLSFGNLVPKKLDLVRKVLKTTKELMSPVSKVFHA